MYKILSLDGGGVRGYLTCLLLAHLEDKTGKKVGDMFDLVVGTSSGAFLTGCLDSLYASYSASLLRDSLAKRLFKRNSFSFNTMLRSKYNSKSRCEAIEEVLSFKSIKNYDYAILSYDLLSRRPVIFNSLLEEDSKSLFTGKYSIDKAVCASSAAPIYWNPYKLDDMLLVDGAFLSNDPTSVGIKLALDQGINIEDLLIVNIGTGLNTRSYKLNKGSNPIKWLVPTFNVLTTSQSQLTNMLYTNKYINYFSLNCDLLEANDDIDDISIDNFKALERESSKIILNNQEDIEKIVNKLLK